MGRGAKGESVAPLDVEALTRFVSEGLAAEADPEKAAAMAAYMKTDMPFYGVQKPARVPVLRAMKRAFKPNSSTEYRTAVKALWALPHREEKYAALEYAGGFVKFIEPEALGLYERLIREGQWWDLVDHAVSVLINPLMKQYRSEIRPIMDQWIDDDDQWIRRAAILCQLKLKGETDAKQLFGCCLKRAHEKGFFIRKAIGWALRQYSYTDPDAVKSFLVDNRSRLSGLSYREGAKRLVREGLL